MFSLRVFGHVALPLPQTIPNMLRPATITSRFIAISLLRIAAGNLDRPAPRRNADLHPRS
jgi:hypothetical protein